MGNKKVLFFYEALDLKMEPMTQPMQKVLSDSYTRRLPIIVKIAATHAGIVTRNLTRYNPDAMARSCQTWLQDYGKPILKHHLMGGQSLFGPAPVVDPIGRVINAEYIRTALTNNDAEHEPSTPVGYIQIIARIADPDAIEKILDGRFLTVSVGSSTSDVKCSICDHDISSGELCEHVRGKRYGDDNKLCYWNIGDLDYKECSFVNAPADKYAQIIGVQFENNTGLASAQSQEGQQTTNKDSAVLNVLCSQGKEDSMGIFFSDEHVPQGTLNDGQDPNVGLDWNEDSLSIVDFLVDILEKDPDGLLKDAKYTTKQRKGMPSSAFCGKKDRSFPITDCKHVAVALTYLGRYKGPSSKADIKACIARKARELGCKGSKATDSAKEFEALQDTDFALIKGVDKDKVRSYPMDTMEHTINSLENLIIEDELSTEEKKAVYDTLSGAAGKFGIKVDSWDPQVQDFFKWSLVKLNEATLEQITALPIVNEHLKGFIRTEEAQKLNGDEGLKAGMKALSDKLVSTEKQVTDLTAELEQRKQETVQVTTESSKLHQTIQRDLAEKVVLIKIHNGEITGVNSEDEFKAQVDEYVKRERVSLEDTLKDQGTKSPLWKKKVTDTVSPADAASKTEAEEKFEGSVPKKRIQYDADASVEEMLGLPQKNN